VITTGSETASYLCTLVASSDYFPRQMSLHPSCRSKGIEVKKRDRLLGILSLGQLDTEPEHLSPTSPGVTAIGSSSDHTI